MADVGMRRQREDQSTSSSQPTGQSSNLTASERMEGRGRQSQGMERNQQGRNTPSVFSVSPGEFFTMSPITLMRRFTEDIDRAFGLSTSRGRGSDLDSSQDDITWMPTVEVRQQGNNLVIHADLPGLAESDVRVEATEDGLVIQGERRREQTVEDLGIVRSERVYGRFYRLIPLPEGAKVEDAKANFWGGVLEVTVPVPELEKRRRQIPVSANQSAQSTQSSQPSTSGQGDRGRAVGSGR